MSETFHIRVNGGAERTITVETGIYQSAAAAVPAFLGLKVSEFPITIEMWVPELLPEYGPYRYYIEKLGDRVATLHRRWDGLEVACYS